MPADLAHYDEDTGTWWYAAPDWTEVKRVITEGGPAYKLYLERVKSSLDRNGVYRTAALSKAA
jgi:ring-1,2-phenylacetyl-CoA epoxidase subunit PaaA